MVNPGVDGYTTTLNQGKIYSEKRKKATTY